MAQGADQTASFRLFIRQTLGLEELPLTEFVQQRVTVLPPVTKLWPLAGGLPVWRSDGEYLHTSAIQDEVHHQKSLSRAEGSHTATITRGRCFDSLTSFVEQGVPPGALSTLNTQ